MHLGCKNAKFLDAKYKGYTIDSKTYFGGVTALLCLSLV